MKALHILTALALALAAALPAPALAEPPAAPAAAADTAAVAPPSPGSGGCGAWRRDFSYAGLPLMAAGVTALATGSGLRSEPRHFSPKGNTFADNALPYAPLAFTAALKACGGATRSSWGRLAVSSAFSGLLMAGAAEGLKRTVDEWRPDGADRRSFPSGHTATAFMCATVMSKELGWRSPWYSAGAYAVASACAVTRIINNRHWAGDVVFGAGLGITATDLGYVLADLIFRDRGCSQLAAAPRQWTPPGRPSYFAVTLAAGTAPSLPSPGGLRLHSGATVSTALEGAWFWSSHWGVGGRARLTAMPVVATPAGGGGGDAGVSSSSWGVVIIDAGIHFSARLSERWRLGLRALAGDRISTRLALDAWPGTEGSGAGGRVVTVSTAHALSLTGGVSVSYDVRPGTALRLFADCSHARPHYRCTVAWPEDTPPPSWLQPGAARLAATALDLSVGMAVDVMLR